MTPPPMPPWADLLREVIEDELRELGPGLTVSVCWLPRKGQVVFTVKGVEVWPRVWRGKATTDDT